MERPSTVIRSTGPSAGEWELHQPTIKRLYLDQDRTLPDVMKIMQQQYSFKASTKMFKRRLTLWKMDSKNLKKSEVKQIAHMKVVQDAAGKRSAFQIKGRQIDARDVVRYVNTHGFSTLVDYVQASSPFVNDDEVICLYASPVAIFNRGDPEFP